MNDGDLIRALRRIKVETGSLVCLGCGHEHNCSIHGCAVINAAIGRLEVEKNTTLGGTYVSVEWFERVEAELKKYKATGFEPEEISGLCSMSERAKLADLLRLEEYQALGTIDHIRELVQAEKNGWLVALPCKPDAVAWAHSITGDLSEFQFEGICISKGKEISYQTYWGETFSLGDFGKTVFLTHEEAEAALKK